MTLVENRGITGVICKMRLYWSRAGPLTNNNLYKGKIWTQTPMGKMVSINGVTLPQAKELPEAKREAWPANTLISGF